jgi:hypothetical protein
MKKGINALAKGEGSALPLSRKKYRVEELVWRWRCKPFRVPIDLSKALPP